MATIIATTGFYLVHPWWLTALLLLVPVVWMGQRHLRALGPVRRWSVIVLRCLGILLIVLILGRLMRTRRSEDVTVIVVADRSLSIPAELQTQALDYLDAATGDAHPRHRLAMVDVAETATIAMLPTTDPNIPRRNTTLSGEQTHLARGIQLALAIIPPDSGARICLTSEGNQTAGDLQEAARIAAANRIPIDVLPLHYRHEREVVFRRLNAPAQARSSETVPLRFIVESTRPTVGQLQLHVNGQPLDLDPDSPGLGSPVNLTPGLNVKTVSVPLGPQGIHEFEASFIPAEEGSDQVTANNGAHALTVVAGAGQILIATGEEASAAPLLEALQGTDLQIQAISATELPDNLNRLLDSDAIVLLDVDASLLTYSQMEMLQRYVTELGGAW